MKQKRATERRTRLRSAPFTLAMAASLFLAHCSEIQHDETECQEASAHLEDCCRGFDARNVQCATGTSGGCGSSVPAQTFPATFAVSDSECILDSSCGDLVAKGVCARAIARTAPILDSGADAGHAGTEPSGALCF